MKVSYYIDDLHMRSVTALAWQHVTSSHPSITETYSGTAIFPHEDSLLSRGGDALWRGHCKAQAQLCPLKFYVAHADECIVVVGLDALALLIPASPCSSAVSLLDAMERPGLVLAAGMQACRWQVVDGMQGRLGKCADLIDERSILHLSLIS